MPSASTALPRPAYLTVALVAVGGIVVAVATGALGALAALLVVPLAVATFANAQGAAGAGAATVAVAALAGAAEDPFDAEHVTALLAVTLASMMSVLIAAERTARDRIASFASFLGESSTLLACSLDFDATAKAVASIPVPELADWALVEVVAPDGTIERRAASHPDEAAEHVAAALAEVGSEPGRGPRPELWPELPDSLIELWAEGDDERLAAMRGSGARSAVRVPLRTMERTLGSMTLLATTVSSRNFDSEDLSRAEELASRCSIALENAQLYRAARRSERRFVRRAEPQGTERPAPRRDE